MGRAYVRLEGVSGAKPTRAKTGYHLERQHNRSCEFGIGQTFDKSQNTGLFTIAVLQDN